MKHGAKILIIVLLFFVGFLLLAPTAKAQVIGNLEFLKGIVPCGTSYAPAPCTVCHFYSLLQNIINFMLYSAASLATLMATYAAFLFLFSGGSPQKITDAKSKLWLLVWGIVVVLGSWLLINTILNFIVDPKVFPLPWNQINCSISQSPKGINSGLVGGGNVSPFQPGGGSFGGGGASGSWEAVQPAAIRRLDSGVYQDGVDTSTVGYKQLNEEIDGLEQFDPAAPYTTINPINPDVSQELQQVNTGNVVNRNLVKAIIQAESSGNPNAIHLDKDGQFSYGLMQVRPDTAKNYDPSLQGLTDAQIGEKLKNPDYNATIGTAYLEDLAAKYNGNLDKVIAAYNGGPGANGPSRDCPGSLRWQCGWDNQSHTIPNQGYEVTRKYVKAVNNYYLQLSN